MGAPKIIDHSAFALTIVARTQDCCAPCATLSTKLGASVAINKIGCKGLVLSRILGASVAINNIGRKGVVFVHHNIESHAFQDWRRISHAMSNCRAMRKLLATFSPMIGIEVPATHAAALRTILPIKLSKL